MLQRYDDRRVAISEILRELCADADQRVAVGEIVERFGPRAFGAALFVFAIPNLLPLPPGSTTVLGAPLLLLAPQLVLGMPAPWLPRFISRRQLSGAELTNAFGRLLPSVERVEKVSRPRMAFLFGGMADRAIGLVCAALAFVLILPIPLGNIAPALTIGAFGFAMVQRDGVIALFGWFLAAISGGLLYLAADTVMAAARHLIGWFGAA